MMHDFFSPFCFLWWANAQRVVLTRLCSATQKQSKAPPEQSLIGYNAVFFNAELTYHLQPSYLSWHFIWGRDWIYSHRGTVCHNCSGHTKHSSLWPWLAVKSPFNRLLPADITLHPPTLDITTPAWVSWNCSGGVWASLLNYSTIHLSFHTENWKKQHIIFCHSIMHCCSVIFNTSQEFFCVTVSGQVNFVTALSEKPPCPFALFFLLRTF